MFDSDDEIIIEVINDIGDIIIKTVVGLPGAKGEQGEIGPQGIQGEIGPAGPNEITTSTLTNLTGILYGNGSTVETLGEDTVFKITVVGQNFNKLETKTTDALSTEVKKVELPENVDIVTIYHLDTGETLYLSGNPSFIAGDPDVLAVPALMSVSLEVKKGNNVELYCKTSTGSIRAYAYGMVKE